MSQVVGLPEVFTLEDAAAFLRLPADVVERHAVKGLIPGRKVDDSWRFLRTALEDWLRHGDQRRVLLSQAGSLADDDRLAELLSLIYRARSTDYDSCAESS